MSGGYWRRTLLSLLALAIAVAASAQGRSAQNSNSKSISIQIVAYVPPVLKLSLDFSENLNPRLTGYLPHEATPDSGTTTATATTAATGFEIRNGATIDLGHARLFSNLVSSYCVNVYSTNGGSLRNSAETNPEPIPYKLRFGDFLASAVGGRFSFAAEGKSSMNSPSHRVALEIGEIPPSTAKGFYTDQLMFSVSAN